jgi:hypothetical protein
MNNQKTNSKFARFGPLLQEGIFFVFFFLIAWLRIRPTLAVESQQPVFLYGWSFLSDFLRIPGGFADWLSAWLMRGWTADWLAALELTLVVWGGTLLFRRWIEHLTGFWLVHTVQLVPAVFLLVLFTRHDAPFSLAIAWTLASLLLFLFRYESPRVGWIRIPAVLSAMILFYWLIGGAALAAGAALALSQGLVRGKRWEALLAAACAVALPFAASAAAFWIPLKQAAWHGLPIETASIPRFAAWGLSLFFAIAAFGVWMSGRPFLLRPIDRLSGWSVALKWLGGTAVVIGLAAFFQAASTNRFTSVVLEVNRDMRREAWPDALKAASKTSQWDPILSVQVNRALQRTNRLLDDMFAWPQGYGEAGLIPNRALCLAWPEEAARLFYDLGLVGEAQHWAHEAMTIRGPTPDILRLLGTLYMLKGDTEAASNFISNLARTPGGRGPAADIMRCIRKPAELTARPGYHRMLNLMPVEDFISIGRPSKADLRRLLERNPGNRAAFDYLLAMELADGDPRSVWNEVRSGRAPGEWSGRSPRHVQEALLWNAAATPKFDVRSIEPWIERETATRFRRFEQMGARARGNRGLAESALRDAFGGTWWVYRMFDKPASGPAEGPNDFQ